MAADLKAYTYRKGSDPILDQDFLSAKAYGKVKAGEKAIFWKSGLRWYAMPAGKLRWIYRQVEPVYGKLCCGGRSFFIERLVLVLHGGEELVIHIGDDVKKEAEALLEQLRQLHPELSYGKA